MQYALNYSGTRFLYTHFKITQFTGEFRFNIEYVSPQVSCHT